MNKCFSLIYTELYGIVWPFVNGAARARDDVGFERTNQAVLLDAARFSTILS